MHVISSATYIKLKHVFPTTQNRNVVEMWNQHQSDRVFQA